MEKQCIDEALTQSIYVDEGTSTKSSSPTQAAVKADRDQNEPTNCERKATKSLGLKLLQNPHPQIFTMTMPNSNK